MSVLAREGYVVHYDDLSQEHVEELTVTQDGYDEEKNKTFEVFKELEDGTVAVPRYWGEKHFGKTSFAGNVYDAPGLTFAGSLRSDVQRRASDVSVQTLKNKGGGILSLMTGAGKCHGINTPILMYDGSIKMVQDVEIGDYLMGDDSTPRKVLSLATGVDEMYDIIPVKGDKYTVNQEHILVLKNNRKNPNIRLRLQKDGTKKYDVQWWENRKFTSKVCNTMESAKLFVEEIRHKHQNIIEIPVKDYIIQKDNFKHHYKGYRTPIDFSEKALPIDPYMIGVWLGDGNSDAPQFTSQDGLIIVYFVENLAQYGLYLTKLKSRYGYGIRSTNRINLFRNTLRILNMINNKHIPMIYKCNSRVNRLRLLAGLLDTDGSYGHNCFDFIQKSEQLIDDVVYLCRSLGFACYKKIESKGCWYKGTYSVDIYYRICISGDDMEDIPTLLLRKKAIKRTQIKDPLVTGIQVKHIGKGIYYGFTLDGNSRYVLGDFTVTHNTVVSLHVACIMKVKTLVIVHKTFLSDQWIERIQQFVPGARIGRIQQNKTDVEGCDIVIGMLQSVAMREYDPDVFDGFGLVIFDEVHVVPAPVFSRALLKLCAPYLLGLSATPERKDGLTYVIEWFVGDVIMEHRLKDKSEVTVQVLPCELFIKPPYRLRNSSTFYSIVSTMLCKCEKRNDTLVRAVLDLTSKGKKTIFLSDRRAHCELMKDRLDALGISNGLYLGGMFPYELDESATKDVILATFSLAKEGLDIPSLDAVVLASPRSDVVQACGRILHREVLDDPIIVDVVDQWTIGKSQFNKRKIYYDEAGFTVNTK